MTKPENFKDWDPDAPRPDKRTAEIPATSTTTAFCDSVYEDVANGEVSFGECTVGGRALLISCNIDANRVQKWKEGDSTLDIYNARALHFLKTQKTNTLPGMMRAGELVLVEAWIQGEYRAAKLPHEPDLDPVEEEAEQPQPQVVSLPTHSSEPAPNRSSSACFGWSGLRRT